MKKIARQPKKLRGLRQVEKELAKVRRLHLRLELGRIKISRVVARELKVPTMKQIGSVTSLCLEAEHAREVRLRVCTAAAAATIMTMEDTAAKDTKGPGGADAKTSAIGNSGSVRRRCMGLGRVAEGGAAAVPVTIIRKETTTGPVHGRSGREVLGTPDTTLGELEEIGVKELVAAKGEEAGS
jgi:hypothetical protein